MKKKIAVGIILVLLIAIVVPNMVSAAGGWRSWWIDGPKIAAHSTTFTVEEPFVIGVEPASLPGETWSPGESKLWVVNWRNDADVPLPGAIYIWTDGYLGGEDARYIITLTPEDPDPTDDIAPVTQTWAGSPYVYGQSRIFLGMLSGENEVVIQITSATTTTPNNVTVHFEFYRGEVVETVYDDGAVG